MVPRRRVLALGLTSVVLLRAADFWAKHKPEQWTPSEVKLVVTDSPWAKQVTIGGTGSEPPESGDLRRGQDANVPGAEPNSGIASRDPRGRGATASNREPGDPASPSVIVRWDSAAPVRAACSKAGYERYGFSCYSRLMYLSGQAEKFEELAKRFYILTVSNYPKAELPARDRDAPQHSAAADSALERLGERLQQGTVLRRKGKPNFGPDRVLVLPAGRVLLVIAFFSRSTVLAAEDGNVIFESPGETAAVRSRFNLSKMVYNGRLEL